MGGGKEPNVSQGAAGFLIVQRNIFVECGHVTGRGNRYSCDEIAVDSLIQVVPNTTVRPCIVTGNGTTLHIVSTPDAARCNRNRKDTHGGKR